jgi:N-acetylneuraminic acid mutarotase
LGYGVSISYNGCLLCIGGSNETGHFASVSSIRYDGSQIHIESLPDLPQPLANSCGALVDHTVYIAGGLHHPQDSSAAKVFWSLDLPTAGEKRKWKELESWPGPARMLAVAGAHSGSFFLFSGTDLKAASAGQVQRVYLRDAYQFTPDKGWKKLSDLPQAAVAAPTPAYCEDHALLIFGGDDGELAPKATVLKEYHPGFSNQILKYTILENHWAINGIIKTDKRKDAAVNPNGSTWAPVTTPLVEWKGNLVFPSGEVRPAIRTPKVLMACPAPKKNGEETLNPSKKIK